MAPVTTSMRALLGPHRKSHRSSVGWRPYVRSQLEHVRTRRSGSSTTDPDTQDQHNRSSITYTKNYDPALGRGAGRMIVARTATTPFAEIVVSGREMQLVCKEPYTRVGLGFVAQREDYYSPSPQDGCRFRGAVLNGPRGRFETGGRMSLRRLGATSHALARINSGVRRHMTRATRLGHDEGL